MIVPMKQLLDTAKEKDICVGAFGVYNMEMIMGAISAAEEKQTPIIIQVAQARLKHCPMEYIAPMMVESARKSKIDIAVHFDHGLDIEHIKKSLDYGFSSVMFDGSKLKLEENISKTNEVIELAKKYNATVEAELGIVGGSEGLGHENIKYTDVNEAIEFCKSTNIQALAIAIGNVHGQYKGEPHLNFEVLKEIHRSVDNILVLHGGSGISYKDFQKAIHLGVRKINIATDVLNSCVKGCKNYLNSNTDTNYFDMNKVMVEEVKKTTMNLLDVFNCTVRY